MVRGGYKMNASVKIMLSYDYNHFEVSLSAENLDLNQVNELRKSAQRLADEAVRQYKVSKEKASRKEQLSYEKDRLTYEVKRINEKPESEWTAEEKAKVKALSDEEYFNRFNYNYEDDFCINED